MRTLLRMIAVFVSVALSSGCDDARTPDAANGTESVVSAQASESFPFGAASKNFNYLYGKLRLLDADLDGRADAVEDSVIGGGGGLSDGDKGDIVVSGGGAILVLDSGSVTTAKIGSGQVTAAKLADGDYGAVTLASGVVSVDAGVIGATQLASTSVTPGSYAPSAVTVDADGRLTAAATATAAEIGSVVDSRYLRLANGGTLSGNSPGFPGIEFRDGGARLSHPDETLLGTPDTNCFFRIETMADTPTDMRTIMDFTTDSATEAGGLLLRTVNSSATTNDLLRVNVTYGLDSPYGFKGPGANITGVNAATLGGTALSALVLKASPIITGALNFNGNSATNLVYLSFDSPGGAQQGNFMYVDETDSLHYVSPGASDSIVLVSSDGLVALSLLAEGGATSGQVLTYNGVAWAPAASAGSTYGTYTPFKHQTGSSTNAIMRTWYSSGAPGTIGDWSVDFQGVRTTGEGALATHSGVLSGRNNYIRANAYRSVICGGDNNEIGSGNTSSGGGNFIGGGVDNTISLDIGYFYVVIAGGRGNVAGGYASAIGGGDGNAIGNVHKGVISGGMANSISGVGNNYCTIGGGRANTINTAGCEYSGIAFGYANNITTSGDYCVIGGGTGHDITGVASFLAVLSGENNNITGAATASVIAGGSGCDITSTASYSVIGGGAGCDITSSGGYNVNSGGSGNVVSGTATYATIIGGRDNRATANYSTAMGRDALAQWAGVFAHSAGKKTAAGDRQTLHVDWHGTTTDATTTEIFLGGDGTSVLSLPSNSVMTYDLLVTVARSDSAGDTASYARKGRIKNIGGITTLIEIAGASIDDEDAGAAACVFTVSAVDATIDYLKLDFAGEASKTYQVSVSGTVNYLDF